MTLPIGFRWAARWLALLGIVIVSLALATTAQAAAPSLLAGEQVDGHNSALNAVSCASASYCVTGGLDLIVQDHAVRSDLTTKLSNDTDELSAISCAPGTEFCALMDDSGGAYTMTNGTLSSRTPASAGNTFMSVSCPTATFCMAIDDHGDGYEYTPGTSWTLTSSTVGDQQISCATASFCIATGPRSGGSGIEDAYKWDGVAWEPAHAIEGGASQSTGLSCPTTTFCVATDSRDNALTSSDGNTWTTTADSPLIAGGTNSDGLHVSCVPGSALLCMVASEQTGVTFTTTDGSTWAAGTNIKQANGGVGGGGPTSCASITMCVIVDLSGTGYTYALPDTATAPTLAGAPAVGAAITLTPGIPASPDTSVVNAFQRCVGASCTALSATTYTTTAADIDATFKDAQTSGVGLDLEGPLASNTVGPIAQPSTGTGTRPGTGTRTGAAGKASPAKVAVSASGAGAKLALSCPAASPASCHVTATLTVSDRITGKKHRKTTRTVTLGSAATTITAGGHRTITVSLNGAGRALLGRRHTLKVTLAVTQDDRSLATRTIRLSSPTHKKHKHKHKHKKK